MRIIVPLGEHSLVQIHQDRVLLGNLSIKDTLHMSMSAETFLDVASPTILGPQLHWLEPLNVLPVEEHEPHS